LFDWGAFNEEGTFDRGNAAGEALAAHRVGDHAVIEMLRQEQHFLRVPPADIVIR